MFGNGQLTCCQQHKAALLQHSPAHRCDLAKDAQTLRAATEWVDLGIDISRKARAGWTALGPLLSLWQTRNQEPSGFIHKLAGAISLACSLTALWKNWR